MKILSHVDRVEAEIENFRQQVNIHDLPDIFHYWSNKYLGPYIAQAFDSGTLSVALSSEIRKAIAASGNPKVVSIGAGDGQIEIGMAKQILSSGVEHFQIECLELSPHLIERGRAAVAVSGLGQHISFRQTDLTSWAGGTPFGAAFAHHSLHHIVALEHVFDIVRRDLLPGGAFVIADMIGRNGHMRWPETLFILERIWGRLPPAFKFNHQHGRTIDPYENWDCSNEGFEGIRAQDILPLLLERFHMRRFAAWGSLLDQFIDRGYGHNFDHAEPAHQTFVDDLWAADQALIRLGVLTPTQMVAVLQKEPGELQSSNGLDPAMCVRRP